MSSIGDSQTVYVNSTTTIRPLSGETWKLDWFTVRSTSTANVMKLEITDGTKVVPIEYTNQPGGSIDMTETWGKMGNYRTTTSAANVLSGGFQNCGHGGIILDYNFYLSITVYGTCYGFFGVTTVATSADQVGASRSVIVNSTQDIRPAAGEHWGIVGFAGQSGWDTSTSAKSFTTIITNGTNTMPYIYVSGNYEGSGYFNFQVLTFGVFGNKYWGSGSLYSPWVLDNMACKLFPSSGTGLEALYGRGISITNSIYLSCTVTAGATQLPTGAFCIVKLK